MTLNPDHYFEVQLIKSIEQPEVFLTSGALECMHDANEWLRWLSCKFSTPVIYQIVEYTLHGFNYYCKPYPINKRKPTNADYCPPEPLYRQTKRRRRDYREARGLYYIIDGKKVEL